MKMKLLLTILIAQVLGLTSAQSDCKIDTDTFEDGTGSGARGKGCSFYKGKDCVAEAQRRGVAFDQIRQLLNQCKHACGFCGKNTIVKTCKDNSCKCKDTPNWQLTTLEGQKLECTQKSSGACISRALALSLSDKQIREYLTNCASSCETCSPCGNVAGVGDNFCDPGNNHDKCNKVKRDGTLTPAYDGGDCCNKVTNPFFMDFGENSMRYEPCVKSGTLYDKNYCKCLAPGKRTKDCVGGFGDYGPCSVTCEAVGVRIRTFVVLTPAQAGGRECEYRAGEIQKESCGRVSLKCPTTTSTTTPSTASTATTSKSITVTASTSTVKQGGSTNSTDDSNSIASEVDVTTVSTMITTVACLIYSLV